MKRRSRTPARDQDEERGFSLIETVVAAGIVAGAFAALAQVFALSIAHNVAARDGSAAMVLAAQKMEQLRGLIPGVDLNEGGTLASSVDGFADYLDQAGNTLDAGGQRAAGNGLRSSLVRCRHAFETRFARHPGAGHEARPGGRGGCGDPDHAEVEAGARGQ